MDKLSEPGDRLRAVAKRLGSSGLGVSGGDLLDFEQLYRDHAREVHRYAHFLSGDEAHAEDIVSETFIRVWSARDRVEMRTVRSYLLTIARNLFLQGKRHTDREVGLTELIEDSQPRPGEAAQGVGQLQRTLAALRRLEEVDRSAILLRAEGMSYSELGVEFGITSATARVRVSRARSRLRKIEEETQKTGGIVP